MSYAIPYKGITRFFNTELDAETFCKLAMLSQSVIIKAQLR
jgi:hypothetical protein